MSEILAPAGDKNCAIAAINAGADAIYLGLKQYSARSSAENFDFDSLEEICGFAHAFGVKVYVAMNTLVKDNELEGFLNSVIEAHNRGADAIILSDIFIGKFLKVNYPQLNLHLSTQAGVCNVYAASIAKEYGFSRVILSRETCLEDIKAIAAEIETEVFVQGALCTCFSGQCYLSSFAGGNSGNRGKCKQPCRKKYILEDSVAVEPSYRLSLSDLCVGDNIQQLIEAGVFSFKIEGRMRRPEYVVAAVDYYKKLIENEASSSDLSALKRTYNRGNYTKGLAFGQDRGFLSQQVQGHIGEYVGTVKIESGKYICYSLQKFLSGDGFKILRDGREVAGASFLSEIRGGFVLSSRTRLKNGDKVFITTDTALNQKLLSNKRRIPIKISADFSLGKFAEITVNGIKFVSEKRLQKAENKPLTVEAIRNCFKKVDLYPFFVEFDEIKTDYVFMTVSELNAFRRNVFDDYYKIISDNPNEKLTEKFQIPQIKNGRNEKIAAIYTDEKTVPCNICIYKPFNYADITFPDNKFSGDRYLYLPPYLTGAEVEKIKSVVENFDGIYCDGLYGFKLCEELKKPLFSGTGLNISNRIGLTFCNAKYIAFSKELTLKETGGLATENSFYLSAGAIKVMDLIYCPFEKKCGKCQKRREYALIDEEGRKFTLRRYITGDCRFELFNCVNLAADKGDAGVLADCTLENKPENLLEICKESERLKEYYAGNFTRGHSVHPVR